jgi:hypothetical protein
LTPEQEARQATLLAEIVKLQKQTTAWQVIPPRGMLVKLQ